MKVTAFLCDYADDAGGKLNIIGGGWSLIVADQPVPIALAIKIGVPWDQANRPHELSVRLLDTDSNPFVAPNGQPVEMVGKIEVGRPPGLRPGTNLDAQIVVRIPVISFPQGRYTWEIKVDDEVLENISFDAIERGVNP